MISQSFRFLTSHLTVCCTGGGRQGGRGSSGGRGEKRILDGGKYPVLCIFISC